MDGYNTWLNPSAYDSFRYVNYSELGGKIPPKDISLVRLLMTPEMVDWYKGYEYKIPNLTLNEFRNMLTYKTLTNWNPTYYKEWEIERLYMETQGNYDAYH